MMNLINKQDNSSVVRDAIARVLKAESDNQQALAIAEGIDPEPWTFDTFIERSEPWSLIGDDLVPIVSVTLEKSTFDGSAGNTDSYQVATGIFAIKVHAASPARETSEGHDPADYIATMKVQHVCMLVRNILLDWTNRYLGIDKSIIQRKSISDIEYFGGKELSSNHISAAQVTMSLTFPETTEIPTPSILEETNITINSDGQLVNNIQVEL